MILRSLLAFLALPTLVAGVFPLFISWIPSHVLFRSGYSAVLITAGASILLLSVVSFYRLGLGTLAPWDPPKHLVVGNLYRFNRNPMYVGVVIIIFGWALLTGNIWNYVYAGIVPVIFHFRVLFYEEREMERLFGKEWEAYQSFVPRWGVSLRPYRPIVEQGASPDAAKPRREL